MKKVLDIPVENLWKLFYLILIISRNWIASFVFQKLAMSTSPELHKMMIAKSRELGRKEVKRKRKGRYLLCTWCPSFYFFNHRNCNETLRVLSTHSMLKCWKPDLALWKLPSVAFTTTRHQVCQTKEYYLRCPLLVFRLVATTTRRSVPWRPLTNWI